MIKSSAVLYLKTFNVNRFAPVFLIFGFLFAIASAYIFFTHVWEGQAAIKVALTQQISVPDRGLVTKVYTLNISPNSGTAIKTPFHNEPGRRIRFVSSSFFSMWIGSNPNFNAATWFPGELSNVRTDRVSPRGYFITVCPTTSSSSNGDCFPINVYPQQPEYGSDIWLKVSSEDRAIVFVDIDNM